MLTAKSPTAEMVPRGGEAPYLVTSLDVLDMHSLLAPVLEAEALLLDVKNILGLMSPSNAENPAHPVVMDLTFRANRAWLTDMTINNFLTLATEYATMEKDLPVGALKTISAQASHAFQRGVQPVKDRTSSDRDLRDVLRHYWATLEFEKPGEFMDNCHDIIIPFSHGGSHWTLVTISGRRREIKAFDSLSAAYRPEFTFALCLLEAGLGAEFVMADWKMSVAKTHQQTDADSCGVHTCLNGLAACLGIEPLHFIPEEDARVPMFMREARTYIAACLIIYQIITTATYEGLSDDGDLTEYED